MSDQSASNNIVTIGGRQFAASCLTLGVMRRNVGALKLVMEMRSVADPNERSLPTTEQFDAVITIVGQSLTPVSTEPSVSFATFVDGLAFRSAIADLLNALRKIMELSGYIATAQSEESSDPGEAQRAAPLT